MHADAIAQREARKAIESVRYHASNPEYDDAQAAELSIMKYEIQFELLSRYGKGICCFSEHYNNALLWSHYGEQHRGLCIGYSIDRRPIPELKKVACGGDRTVKTSLLARAFLNKHSEAIEELDASVLLRKAPDWTYAKEWRLIGSIGLQDSPLKLTEVTFGLRCEPAVRHTVMNALTGRRNSIDFYEMLNVRNTYNLERVPVNLEDTMYLPSTAMSGLEASGDDNICSRII